MLKIRKSNRNRSNKRIKRLRPRSEITEEQICNTVNEYRKGEESSCYSRRVWCS